MNFIINKIKNRFFLDKNEINFINFAKNNNKIISEESVLIEAAIDDNFLLIKNFLIGSYLQKKYKLKLVYYLNYFKSRAYKSLLKNIYNFFVYNYFSFLKCEKKYNSFCYKNVLNLNVLSKKKKFFNFKKLNFNKLIKLKYKGIKLGDLLIDSYQYYYYDFLYYDDLQKIIYDKRFQKLLIDSFLAVDHFEQVFQKYKIRILVNNYSGYLEHGIAARMAEKNKIPIFYVSDPDIAFIKSYASKHKKDYSKYKYKFKNHQINNANYNESKKLLSRRFQGFLDPAVHYLNDSVYNKNSKENLKLNNNKKKICIFLHSTVDSLYGFKYILFYSQKIWIELTIKELLKLYNLDFYEILVKIHPNENQLGEKYILNILKRYPSVKIIDKNCNNLEIIKNGLIVGITLHGTIGLELAYHKIPTIYGHDNPYVAFNFCLKSSSIKQYKKQLKKIHTLKKNIKYRQEAFQFYYMHNFYVPSNKIKNNEIVNLKKFYNYRGNGQTNIIKSFLKDSRKKIDEKLNILEGCFDNAVI